MPITQACHQHLLALARAYSREAGVPQRVVARQAYGDGRLFDKIRRGAGSVTLPKYDELVAWFRENWTVDVAFPELDLTAPAPRRAPGESNGEEATSSQDREEEEGKDADQA